MNAFKLKFLLFSSDCGKKWALKYLPKLAVWFKNSLKSKTLSLTSDVFQTKILWFVGTFIALERDSTVFSVLFLYEWKSKHNAAFGNSSVNECIIWRWYAKFEIWDESLTSKDWGRPETTVDNKVLWVTVEKNLDNTLRDYAEKLGASHATISCHLKLIGKV